MLWYLWDNAEVRDLFVKEYFITTCSTDLRSDDSQAELRANQLIEMVVHDMFLEQSIKFPDWRVVEI